MMKLTTAKDAMSTDWITALTEQARLVQRVTKETSTALAHPELTPDQLSRIYAVVEQGTQEFDRIVEDMNGQDLDDGLYVAARRIKDIWSALAAEVDNEIGAIEGREPLESRDEN